MWCLKRTHFSLRKSTQNDLLTIQFHVIFSTTNKFPKMSTLCLSTSNLWNFKCLHFRGTFRFKVAQDRPKIVASLVVTNMCWGWIDFCNVTTKRTKRMNWFSTTLVHIFRNNWPIECNPQLELTQLPNQSFFLCKSKSAAAAQVTPLWSVDFWTAWNQ